MKGNSSILYLSVYAISVFLFSAAQRRKSIKASLYQNGGNTGFGYGIDVILVMEYFFAVLIPCLLAAFRDPSVGIDANTYIVHNYVYVQNSGEEMLPAIIKIAKLNELFFAILIYLCAKINSLSLLFFIIQLLIMVPLLMALNRLNVSYFYGMTIFYLLLYNVTLGLMRQSIAAAILVLAYTYIKEDKKWKAILLSIVSFFFHKSAIFVFALFVVYKIIKKSRYKKIMYYLSVFFMIYILFQGRGFGESVQDIIGSFMPSYVRALKYQYTGAINTNMVSWSNILTHGVLILTTAVVLKISNAESSDDSDLFYMCIIGIFLRLLSMRILIAVRMAEYFDMFLVLYIPKIRKGINDSSISRLLLVVLLLAICIPFWYFFYIYKNNMNTALYIYKGWQ